MSLLKVLSLALLCLIVPVSSAQQSGSEAAQYDQAAVSFVGLLLFDSPVTEENLGFIKENWEPGFVAMAVEVLGFSRNPKVTSGLLDLLQEHTGQDFGRSTNEWYRWMWNQDEVRYAHYAQFKSLLYRMIDEKFEVYFDDGRVDTIRLDEVRWGGVRQDGIPPLRKPKMITAGEAEYLDDDNVVFGIKINGDARAYPKRILAWHEMFVDTIGGTEYAGVYCTLCGAVILYETRNDGVYYDMGTSGFLYRSNKLMYDRDTQSLWNTTWGVPVIGPLVGKGIELRRSYVVTTTWGEWKRRHPDTSVLSLETGHQRDYGEGVAYHDYFATDELMFDVPNIDDRLKNKDEILALVFPDASSDTMAISAEFLDGNPVYRDSLAGQEFVVLTDGSGANRVYASAGMTIVGYDGDRQAMDQSGGEWVVREDALVGPEGQEMVRLPAHRAFWFGWYAANPDTRLVK